MDKRDVGLVIQSLRRKKGIDRKGLAITLGVDISWLTKIENGKGNPALEKILLIAEALKEEPYRLFTSENLALRKQSEPVLQLNVPGGEFEGVRCYDSPVCLGPGYNMDEAQVVGYLPIHKSELPKGYKSEPDRIACFHTNGASMLPTILPDSHIVIDRFVPAEWVNPGSLYAFLLPSGDVTIKRLVRIMEEALVIDADNQDLRERREGSTKDFPLFLPLREDCSVVRGRVIWIFNRLVEKSEE